MLAKGLAALPHGSSPILLEARGCAKTPVFSMMPAAVCVQESRLIEFAATRFDSDAEFLADEILIGLTTAHQP